MDLREALDQEQKEKDSIQKLLNEKNEAYKPLKLELEREMAEKAKFSQQFMKQKEDLQAELEMEKAEKTEKSNISHQLMKQREDLHDALRQKKLKPNSNEKWVAAVSVLTNWLEGPDEGPDKVADMFAKLSELVDDRRSQRKTATAEPRKQSQRNCALF